MELIYTQSNTDEKPHYKLNKEGMRKLQKDHETKEMKIAVISVFGNGGSVIFDLLLKYAIHRYKEGKSEDENWIGTVTKSKNSIPKCGKSVVIWPEIFVAERPSGEKIGILLMSSQCILNHDLEAAVFAINVHSSSCLIIHNMMGISEEQLKLMELFVEFAKNVYTSPVERIKPFHKLLFLVRGWQYKSKYAFGSRGGHRYLVENVFFQSHVETLTLAKIKTRHSIMSSFDEMTGFLLPDIGNAQRTMADSFSEHARTLVQEVLSPENLVLKQIDGELATIDRLFQHWRNLVRKLNDPHTTKVTAMYRPFLQTEYQIGQKASLKLYEQLMSEHGVGGAYIEPLSLEHMHNESKVIAMNFFTEKYEYDAVFTEKYKDELSTAIDNSYMNIQNMYSGKNIDFMALLYMPILAASLLCVVVAAINSGNKQNFHKTEETSTYWWMIAITFWIGIVVIVRWLYLLHIAFIKPFFGDCGIWVSTVTVGLIYLAFCLLGTPTNRRKMMRPKHLFIKWWTSEVQ